jgi:hypothetical protein
MSNAASASSPGRGRGFWGDVIARSGATTQSSFCLAKLDCSRSLSSGAHSRDPLAGNDGPGCLKLRGGVLHLSPCGRGRIASPDAIRVRGCALSIDRDPSPTRGEGAHRHAACEMVPHSSGEHDLHPPQPRQVHRHPVAGFQPQRLHQTPGQHNLPRAQAMAAGGEVICEPCQGVVRMT